MKKIKIIQIIISLLLILLVLYTGCELYTTSLKEGSDGGDGETTPIYYAIGDIGPSGIGIVFYITDGGLHGLEAAPSGWNVGVDPTSIWSNVNDPNGPHIGIDAQGKEIGTGFLNSNAIISQNGHTTSAAKLCRDYTGGGKNDWFLPSEDELKELHEQRNIVGGFTANVRYWSSTESDNDDPGENHARCMDFDIIGNTHKDPKSDDTKYVRPVRAF